jgi:hypothetical protein
MHVSPDEVQLNAVASGRDHLVFFFVVLLLLAALLLLQTGAVRHVSSRVHGVDCDLMLCGS